MSTKALWQIGMHNYVRIYPLLLSQLGSSSVMAPTTLLELSNDEFHMIFQLLSQSDLLALCLTCKTLCRLPEPTLYSEVKLNWSTSSVPPIAQLLRSLFSRPQLSTYVQALVLEGTLFERRANYGPTITPNIPVTTKDMEKPISWIKSLKVPYQKLWIRQLEEGNIDALVTVLISQLSRLRSAKIGSDFASDNPILGRFLKSALCGYLNKDGGLSISQQLQSVFFTYKYVKQYNNLPIHRNTNEVLPILYLPALQTLSICIDNPITFAWPTRFPPNLSTLVSLDLQYLREDHLHNILSLTTGLKMLKWCWCWNENVAGTGRNRYLTKRVDLDRITEALLYVKDTIEDLTIATYIHYILDGDDPPDIHGSLSGLTKLHHLKRFVVPQMMLNGRYRPPIAKPLVQILPNKLELLLITEDLSDDDDHRTDLIEPLREWLSCWKDHTPMLHTIFFLMDDNEWEQGIRSEMTRIGDEAGVSLTFTAKPHPCFGQYDQVESTFAYSSLRRD
jgi:hypothetical protein